MHLYVLLPEALALALAIIWPDMAWLTTACGLGPKAMAFRLSQALKCHLITCSGTRPEDF